MEDNNNEFHKDDELPVEEFMKLMDAIHSASLEPHVYVQQFKDFDEYYDYIEEGTLEELEELLLIYSDDPYLEKDYIDILMISLRKKRYKRDYEETQYYKG